MHRKEFLDKVQAATGIAEREKVEKATETTLDTLRGRVTPDEAEDVAAQLPSDLKEMWGGGIGPFLARLTGPSKLDEEDFVDRVADKAKLDKPLAEKSVRAVFHTLKEQITPGEAEDLAAQLPKKLKIMWLES